MIWAAERHEMILLARNVVALIGDFADLDSEFSKHPSSNTGSTDTDTEDTNPKDTNPEKVINKWPQFVKALESGNITYEYVGIPWDEIPDFMRELFEIEDGPKHIPVVFRVLVKYNQAMHAESVSIEDLRAMRWNTASFPSEDTYFWRYRLGSTKFTRGYVFRVCMTGTVVGIWHSGKTIDAFDEDYRTWRRAQNWFHHMLGT